MRACHPGNTPGTCSFGRLTADCPQPWIRRDACVCEIDRRDRAETLTLPLLGPVAGHVIRQGFWVLLTTCTPRRFLVTTTRASTMATVLQRPNAQDGALSSLNAAVDALNLAKSISSITPAKAAFDSTGVLLRTIIVGSFLPELVDYWLMHTGLDD